MQFLEKILGEELYKQVEEKINAHNGNEANKESLVKLANLATGEYVAKGKYDNLQASLTGKDEELTKANDLIAELKKGTKGSEEMQGKITAYEGQVQQLQEQLADTKLKAAIKVALLEAKVNDIDYMTFKLEEKLKEKGETLELDENDAIKGFDSYLEGLKTQFPKQFETGEGNDGYKLVENNGLPKGNSSNGLTKEEILKKPYNERQEIYNNNPEAFMAAMNS